MIFRRQGKVLDAKSHIPLKARLCHTIMTIGEKMCLLYMEKKHICVNVYGGNSRTTLKVGLKFKNCGGDGFHFNFFLLQNTSNCTHVNLRNSLDRRSRHTFTIATAQRKYINTRAAQRRKALPAQVHDDMLKGNPLFAVHLVLKKGRGVLDDDRKVFYLRRR